MKSGADSTPYDLFCSDLPTSPRSDTGTVLVTGASGYIGGRLVPELLVRGYTVRIMVRSAVGLYQEEWPGADVVEGDALDIGSLRAALDGVDTAYYLIHSLLLGPSEFASADHAAAVNFRIAAEDMGLKRIIYLGGLGDVRMSVSSHLRSRMVVAEELQKGTVPVTVLRAAVIIGSGSASYEIIKSLVERLIIMPLPPWAENQCQPIAVRDVIKYLVGVLEVPETSGKYYDIGGTDILS